MTKKTIMLCATLFVFFAATAFALCKSSNDKSMKQSDVQRTEKILFVNGSPNRDGNTATLAKELLEGKEYETIALTDYRINFYGQTLDGDQFDAMDFGLPTDQQDNLKLLMGVPLEISVEIGTAKRKVKDILEFTQGTIIELERQAGAPVDVVVNGNLIARGDVVVIDDNFAVRITEIVKSKFMDSLGKE